MKTFTIEITSEAAEQLLPLLEREATVLKTKLGTIERQIAKINKELRPTEGGIIEIDMSPLPGAVTAPIKTASGRAKKGASGKAILAYLNLSNSSGAPIGEIVKNANTSLTTTRRLLTKMKMKNLVSQRGQLWFATH